MKYCKRAVLFVVACLVIAMIVTMLAGCATGKTPEGGVVLGFEAGQLVETGNEAVAVATEGLFRWLGLGGVAGAGGIGSLLYAWAKRKGEAAGWDERDADLTKNAVYRTVSATSNPTPPAS